MNETSRRVLRSLVPVICPPEGVHLVEPILEHMELQLAASPPLMGRAVDAGLLAYDLGAVPRYLRRAHKLTGEAAERYFTFWEHGLDPQVQLARAINQLMSLACYEQPAMKAALGFAPEPWIEEVRKRRLTVYADDVRRQEEQILAPDPLRPVRKKEVA